MRNLISKFVSIFTYDDEDTFFVGKVLLCTNDTIELHLVDENSKRTDIEVIKFSDISYIGFDTKYEREIKNNFI